MNIKKLVIKNFRSFGDQGVELFDIQKINLLIGKNNAGKTNLLRFLALLGDPNIRNAFGNTGYKNTNSQITPASTSLTINDHREYASGIPIEFSIYFEPSEDFKSKVQDLIPLDNLYITYQFIDHNSGSHLLKSIGSFADELPEADIRSFESSWASRFGGTSGGSIEDARNRVPNTLQIQNQVGFPRVEYMSEYRKPTENRPLREKLNEIVNPNYKNQANLKKKKLLCDYFKSVFGFDVDIKIPSLDEEIELVINDKQTPLSSLGAGLQEVILIAFTIVTTQAEIICIDEPELHIHPGAQRELLNLVSQIDGKVFFFATHSNHFLDYEIPNKNIFRLSKVDDTTKIDLISSQSEMIEVLDDLGIRASEIYQTNGVIWVEGASDRIYIKKWIELLAPELKEGLQYTFQYYGGKVLSHYSLTDFEYEEYLNILNINKNAYIVIDSDMAMAYQITDLRDTKQRIITECTTNNIGYWITKGREVENYLPSRVLAEHSGDVVTTDIYKPIEDYCSSFNKNKKVPFSREISEILTLSDIQGNEDLEDKIKEIIDVIRSWNI